MLIRRLWHAAVFATLLVVCGVASGVALAETYVFDKGNTLLTFSWTHLGMSRQQGRVNGYEGAVELDPSRPETAVVDVTLRVNSLQTGFDALDRTLRGADYFDAAVHPLITFKSTAVKVTGEKTADVTGNLTIRGVSKPIILAVSLTFLGDHPLATATPSYAGKRAVAFSARGHLLRSEFGITRATPMVSDEVEIAIETELISQN
jgi:polyisoprenoid-binding protein YceI